MTADHEPRFRRLFAEGAAEFNAGNFFEAHEIWEELWSEEIGDRRRLLQALVQAAAGYHKAEIGVAGGARKLLASALRILDDLPSDTFRPSIHAFRERIRAELAAPGAASERPTIEIAP